MIEQVITKESTVAPEPPASFMSSDPPGQALVSSRLAELARDIKLSHTVFALPFALLAVFLAAGGWPHAGQVGLILVCMVSARTVGMGANRLLDARLDALNPRTRNRAVPAGRLSRRFVAGAIGVCGAVFLAACGGFWVFYGNPWPLILGPAVLLFLMGYPLMKRYTALCHYYLGAALAAAPVCAYVAIAGDAAVPAFLLAGAVLFWTAGFDILYACQDYQSDLETGTFSVPAKIGIPAAFWVARVSHVLAAGFLLALPAFTNQLEVIYLVGAGLACVLLMVEHAVVSPRDLSKLNLAFFTLNGCVSLTVGLLGIVDVLM